MDQIAPGLAGGASVVLLTIALGAIFRVIQLVFKQRRECQDEVEVLRTQVLWEQQRSDEMIHVCQSHVCPHCKNLSPVVIPAIVWRRSPATTRVAEGDHDRP